MPHNSIMNRSWIKKLLLYIFIFLAVYFINVEVQTYFGKKALADTGLISYPLNQARTLALKENKYVLADMSAIWCPSCRRLDKMVFSDTKVKKIMNKYFVFSRIEYESTDGEAFMKKYNVSGFPTLLILDAQGRKKIQIPHTFDAEVFSRFIDQYATQNEKKIDNSLF